MKRIYLLVRKNFLTGTLVLIPLAVVVWLLRAIFAWIWGFYALLPAPIQPESNFGNFLAFLLTCTILFTLVTFLGWASKLYLGIRILSTVEVVIQRIPVLGTVYSALNQLIKTFSQSSASKHFRRVVYVEYPRKGTWVIAFVTGKARTKIRDFDSSLNVFVPTVPNPTSGFHIIVPEADVRESGLTVEAAFKIILSLGIVQGDTK